MSRKEIINALNVYVQAAEKTISKSHQNKIEKLDELKSLIVHCYALQSAHLIKHIILGKKKTFFSLYNGEQAHSLFNNLKD